MTSILSPALTRDTAADAAAAVSTTENDRPVTVAILGAGAQGLADMSRIVRLLPGAHIDLYDRRPAPPGVIAHAQVPHLRLIGNVTIGRDIFPADLHGIYDFVINTTAATSADSAAGNLPDATCPLARLNKLGVAYTLFTAPDHGELGASISVPTTTAGWRELLDAAHGVPICDQ